MFKDVKDYVLRPELLTITVGLLLAFAIFAFLKILVRGLIAPLIAIPFDEPSLDFMNFKVDFSYFAYGAVISAALVVLLALGVALLLARAARGADQRG